MSVMSQFPRKLKYLREEAGLTQAQMADKIGVSRGSISFYENGDRIPDIEVLAAVAREFRVSADWLLGLSPSRSQDASVRLVCGYTGLTEDAVRWLRFFSASDFDGDALVMRFLNGLISSPLLRFRDCAWRHILARLQAESLPQEPVTPDTARATQTEAAQLPPGQFAIPVHDAAALYLDRAAAHVTDSAASALNAFYREVKGRMEP